MLGDIVHKYYKWLYLLVYSFKRVTKYKISILGFRIGETLEAIALILLWRANFADKSIFESRQIVTYFIVGYVIQVANRTFTDSHLPRLIAEGKIVNYLMYPQPILSIIVTRGLGNALATNSLSLLTVPVFVLPFLGYIVPYSGGTFGIFVMVTCFFFNFFLRTFFQIIVCSIAFWTPEYHGVVASADTVRKVLSGYLLPLHIITEAAGWLFLNPFAFTFYHLMQIYLGQYTPFQEILVLIGCILWTVVFYAGSKIAFDLGLKRNESVGL